jgi:hypothetical protein
MFSLGVPYGIFFHSANLPYFQNSDVSEIRLLIQLAMYTNIRLKRELTTPAAVAKL